MLKSKWLPLTLLIYAVFFHGGLTAANEETKVLAAFLDSNWNGIAIIDHTSKESSKNTYRLYFVRPGANKLLTISGTLNTSPSPSFNDRTYILTLPHDDRNGFINVRLGSLVISIQDQQIELSYSVDLTDSIRQGLASGKVKLGEIPRRVDKLLRVPGTQEYLVLDSLDSDVGHPALSSTSLWRGKAGMLVLTEILTAKGIIPEEDKTAEAHARYGGDVTEFELANETLIIAHDQLGLSELIDKRTNQRHQLESLLPDLETLSHIKYDLTRIQPFDLCIRLLK